MSGGLAVRTAALWLALIAFSSLALIHSAEVRFQGHRFLPHDPFWSTKKGKRDGGKAQPLGSYKSTIALHPIRIDMKHPLDEHIDRALIQTIVAIDLREMKDTSFLRRFFEKVRCGGVLFLVPSAATSTASEMQTVKDVERYLMRSHESTQFQPPLYFADLGDPIVESISATWPVLAKGTEMTTAPRLMTTLFQETQKLAAKAGMPKELKILTAYNIEGTLNGTPSAVTHKAGLPTIVIAASYDSAGAAVGLSKGAVRNGSGVTALLEAMRLFSDVSTKLGGKIQYNVQFVLTSASVANHSGAQAWLGKKAANEKKGVDTIAAWISLDGIGGRQSGGTPDAPITCYLAAEPKDDSPLLTFLKALEQADSSVRKVVSKPKKFETYFAWEHEAAAKKKIPALTISSLESAAGLQRGTITDSDFSPEALEALKSRTTTILSALGVLLLGDEGYSALESKIVANDTTLSLTFKDNEKGHRFFALTPKTSPLLTTLEAEFRAHLQDVAVTSYHPVDDNIRYFTDEPIQMRVFPARGLGFDAVCFGGALLYLFGLFASFRGFKESIKLLFSGSDDATSTSSTGEKQLDG